MTGELSYDLVMGDDMGFAEATFRLPGGPWQVVIVSKGEVPAREVSPAHWASGVTGFVVSVPRTTRLDKAVVEAVLTQAVGAHEWVEVCGPDSMSLR